MSDVKDLAQGTHEAFRALINSVVPETASERGGNFEPEALEKLSGKLRELIGDDAIKDFNQQRNERGELVNEEGLPIIDIEEPLPEAGAREPETNSVIQDVPLIRLSSLPSRAREKLRLQRDRILDSLEEEEREENERQKRAEREEREEMRRKRRQESVDEKARLQRAKELQKKMGKALLQNMDPSSDSDSLPKAIEQGKEASSSKNETSEGRKKAVSFVEPSGSGSNARKPDWGDVTAAKLRPGERPRLLQAFRTNNPLKTNVVERKSAGHHSPIQYSLVQNAKDSDDESEPDGNELNAMPDDNDNDDLVEEPFDSEEDTGEVELENEYDLDYAQEQREIALEYSQKRGVTVQDVAKSMTNDAYKEEDTADEAPTNQPEPSVSRFKANRIASAYGPSTHDRLSGPPLPSFLPGSAARTIQQAIKSGRIDDNSRLIGGGNESDSEAEAEGLQEALESLRKGELYNLGPDGHVLYTPSVHNDASTPAILPTSLPTRLPPEKQTQKASLPPLNRPKVSKFKVDRSQAGRPSSSSSSTVSIKPTSFPSPRPSSAKSQNTLSSTIVERKQFQSGKVLEALRPAQTSQTSLSSFPMIVESPSFSAPISAQPNAKMSGTPFISSVVESLSLNDQPRSQFDGSSTLFPMVIESPSFSPPGRRPSRPERPPTVVASQSVARDTLGKQTATHSQSNPIVASTVQERVAPISRSLQHDCQGNTSAPAAINVSQFKQSRGGHT